MSALDAHQWSQSSGLTNVSKALLAVIGATAPDVRFLISNQTFRSITLNDRFWPKAAIRRRFIQMTGIDPKQSFELDAANVYFWIANTTLRKRRSLRATAGHSLACFRGQSGPMDLPL